MEFLFEPLGFGYVVTFFICIINEQLLEATARAVQLVLKWGETGLAVADGLSNLLKVKTDLC